MKIVPLSDCTLIQVVIPKSTRNKVQEYATARKMPFAQAVGELLVTAVEKHEHKVEA